MINRKWVQTKKTQLYTSIGSTATSILLKNAFKLDGSLLDMEDDFGAIGFMTLEPGGLKEEIISFTGLSYNLSGTILTLSGVTRGLSGSSAYGSGGVAYGHSANRVAIFTNNPQHYEGFANKYNEETITQVWTFTETERPKLDVDRDALLAEEFITLGQANRLIQATYLPPQIVASDSGTTGNVQASSLTISHTIPATIENGGTFVVINTEENKTVSTVTLGGVALTQVATKTRVTGNIRVEIWRLIAPASGTANLVITPSANAYITAHVISLSNVNQTTPEDALSTGADGSGTAVADSVTTTTQGAVILMGVGTANDPTTFTPTAPLAEQEVNSASTDRPLSSSVRSTTTAGVYALAYTIAPSTNWVTKAVAIRGIAVPGIAGVSSVTGTYIDNTDPSNPVSVVPLNNTTTTNPTVNDDESLGYEVDSKWYNSATGVLWTCTDATNGAAVWVAVSSGISVGGTSEQNLGSIGPSYNSGPTDTALTAITAETDGSVIYASFIEDSDNPVIVRYEKDQNTGFYKKTHELEISVTGTGHSSLAVIGSYLYVYTTSGANAVDIKRVLSADLSSPTSMTETPGVTGGDDGAMFTDGTDLFINVNTAVGTWKQYSISGTALTFVQDITSGMTGVTNAFYIDGLVYMLDSTDITNTINVYSYTTTFALVASGTFGMGNLGQEGGSPNSTLRGIIPIGASTFYVGFAAVFSGYFSSTGSTSECQNLVIKPFTIPV